MDPKTIEGALAYVPMSLIALIVYGLLKFSITSVKKLVEVMYQDMVKTNSENTEKLDEIIKKVNLIERDTYDIKSMLASFVTVEKHYASTRAVSRDVQDMRERIARIEGPRTP